MKHTRLRLDASTVRLALTYLAIIMVLSIGFSLIFYQMSTSNLSITVQSGASAPDKAGQTLQLAIGSAGLRGAVPNDGTCPGNNPCTLPAGGPNPTFVQVADLNTQLQQRIDSIRSDLVSRLIFLNIGALVLGALFSYYLAHLTLRPMKNALDLQGRFAADASHELRTPLTVMQTEIDVVLRKPHLSPERAVLALRSNYQEVTKLKQLTEGLLRLTQGSQNEQTFSELDLDEVTTEAMNRLLKPAQAKHITIIDSVPSLKVKGDSDSLIQAISILLDNAIKYSPNGRSIHIEGRQEGKRTLLSIRDEGYGIRASDLPHIFERFYRADVSRSKQKISGYGLGLSIAQKIIEQHNGSIAVESTLGQGSIFTITLPSALKTP